MEDLYRVEYNEKQQGWHLERYNSNREPNTHGWKTIIDACSDIEFKVFACYVERLNKKRITIEYLLKCKSEMIKFTNNLIEHRIYIKKE